MSKTNSKDYIFETNNLNVNYGDMQVLWDISFKVAKGEIIAIVGSNGAGKTTIVKAISGLVNPVSGTVKFNDVELAGGSCRTYISNGIIHVPEGRQLFKEMTVLENIEMGASSKEAKEKRKESLKKIYEWFPKLKERKNQEAGTLSGGEQQMVAFARGIMGLPKLLMMDEPSLGLAPNIVDNILNITKEVAKSGIPVILVEQDVRKALRVADRGYVLENGVISIEGAAKELLNDPKVKTAYLGI